MEVHEAQSRGASWWSRGPAVIALMVLLIAGGYGLFAWTSSMGRSSVLKIAQEEGYCASPTDCTEAVATLYDLASDKFGMSGPHLDWCLGVDSWANARVRRGGWLKDIAVWFMYLPCGAMTDSNA